MTSLLLEASHSTPTFKTEALYLISNVQLIKRFYCEMNGKYQYLAFLWQSVTMHFVTKSTYSVYVTGPEKTGLIYT